MTTLQRQARALGDPTRHEVFRVVAQAGRPIDVAELTEHFGLNHNAIRQHLAKLVEAELVVETKAPATGRGRPRLVYEVDPRSESRWGVAGALRAPLAVAGGDGADGGHPRRGRSARRSSPTPGRPGRA